MTNDEVTAATALGNGERLSYISISHLLRYSLIYLFRSSDDWFSVGDRLYCTYEAIQHLASFFPFLKGSQYREIRGVGKVANDRTRQVRNLDLAVCAQKDVAGLD